MSPVLKTLAARGFDAFGLKRRARSWGGMAPAAHGGGWAGPLDHSDSL